MADKIMVSSGKKLSTISRDIYGHFAEHLGRCIYGGFWVGKDSPVENVNGYRKDVIEAFREIDIPNLRWPGGCFADEYHWKDGIGPLEKRKKMINTNWGGLVEDNSFGTNEFFGLCQALGCKAYVNGNVGSGSVQEMSEWIEYMTFAGDSPMSRLREANGRKEPWKLDFFGVGNESWGCGGNMRPEYYADLFRRYQSFVKQYGKNKIFKIACGPSSDDYNWTDVLMKNAGYFMDGLSLHHYCVVPDWNHKSRAAEFPKEEWYLMLKKASYMEELLTRHSQIMDRYDPSKRVALIVDEWGAWHEVEEETNPGFLYQQNTVRDALVAGITLNIFNNHADRVRMANLAQAVNVLQSPILTEGKDLVKTPTWYVFHMYKKHMDASLLKTSIACPEVGLQDDAMISALSASASVKDGLYTVTVTNADLEREHFLDIEFDSLESDIKEAQGKILTGQEMNSMNTFENGQNVIEKSLDVSIKCKNEISVCLPPHSVASITLSV